MQTNDFFAALYDAGGNFPIGYNGDFSFALYQHDLFSLFGYISWATVWFVLILFYFVINHPRFNRWYHLLFLGFTISLINSFIGYTISHNTFTMMPSYDFGIEYFHFAIVNFIVTLLSFVFFSFLFRITISRFSRNCSTCPIPN